MRMRAGWLPLLFVPMLLVACSDDAFDRTASAAPANGSWIAMARGQVDVEGGLIRVVAPRDGRVEEVRVEDGDVVRQGDVLARLESAALQRNPTQFARLMAAALGVAPALAERIATDASGEPLVVAAKALGMSAAVLQRVLLFLDPAIGQSVQRVYDLAQLFDDITPQAATQMTTIWRGQLARKTRAYEPTHYDDERRSARSFASPGRHARSTRATPPARKTDRTG